MPAMNARVTSTNPGRLINRLGKHFRHKIEVEWTETDGVLTFSIGVCRLRAMDNELQLACQSNTDNELKELGQVVASHLIRFSGDEVVEVHWQAVNA